MILWLQDNILILRRCKLNHLVVVHPKQRQFDFRKIINATQFNALKERGKYVFISIFEFEKVYISHDLKIISLHKLSVELKNLFSQSASFALSVEVA